MRPTTIAARQRYAAGRLRLCLGLAAWLVCSPVAVVHAGEPAAGGHHMSHAHHAMAVPKDTGDYQRTEVAYSVPDLTFRDRHGRTIRVAELLAQNRPVMLNFIFTSCTAICPVMTATFAQVQAGLGDERQKVQMVSVSIDPEHDTPERLTRYAQTYKAEDNWRFLTGTLDDSVALQRAFNVYRGDKMNHSPTAFIRVSPRLPWIRIDGFTTARDLINEYRQSQARLSAKTH